MTADQPLKNAPRGWPIDYPRINFLRWKGAAVVQEWDTDAWMYTSQVHAGTEPSGLPSILSGPGSTTTSHSELGVPVRAACVSRAGPTS